MKSKPFIIIAGMHRSGTSFLARALNLSGVYLGSLESLTLTEANADTSNPKGHWESRKFIQIGRDTRSLNKLNLKNIPKKIEISTAIGNEIRKSSEELLNHPSLAAGFKDPFALLYLNAWFPFFPEKSIIVGIFRHPLKVAESLKIRDQRNYEESLSIWKIHNFGLLEALEKHNGFLLNFDWSKEKLLSQLDLVREKIGLAKVDLSEWYSKELIRSNKTVQSNYELPTDIKEIYSKLLTKSENNQNVNFEYIKQSSEDQLKIIEGLLLEIEEQSDYFKKWYEKKLNQEKEKLSGFGRLKITLLKKLARLRS